MYLLISVQHLSKGSLGFWDVEVSEQETVLLPVLFKAKIFKNIFPFSIEQSSILHINRTLKHIKPIKDLLLNCIKNSINTLPAPPRAQRNSKQF